MNRLPDIARDIVNDALSVLGQSMSNPAAPDEPAVDVLVRQESAFIGPGEGRMMEQRWYCIFAAPPNRVPRAGDRVRDESGTEWILREPRDDSGEYVVSWYVNRA